MKKPIVFMFSGQGSQYYQMGRELYQSNSRFQLWMDHCDEIAEPLLNASLVDIIYQQDKSKSEPFDNIVHSNPALLCIQYCLARVLMEMGIKPDHILGYSLGEFTASVLSGAVELEEAIELVIEFGRVLQQDIPASGMLAVIDSADLIQQEPLLFNRVWLTASNFAKNFVVSGMAKDIHDLETALHHKNIMTHRLPVNYGFHSQIIDPVKDKFIQLAKNVNFGAINTPVLSALTAQRLTGVDEEYFWHVVREPVDFEQAVKKLMRQQDCTFIDVGPSGTLATFVKYIRPADSNSEHFEVMNQFGKNLRTLDILKTALVEVREGVAA